VVLLASWEDQEGKLSVGGMKHLHRSTAKRPFDMLVSGLSTQRGPARNRRSSEGLRESSLEELAQLSCGLELRDGLEFFERRSERVGETPDRSRP